ncbi:hypothetical protein AAG570_007271, partial [Ranatra chinensis]
TRLIDLFSQFTCRSNRCLPRVWVCDGSDDCLDGSDEGDETCSGRTCSDGELLCSSGRCIPVTWVCDGTPDCPNREDEPASCSDPTQHSCDPTYFRCANNK